MALHVNDAGVWKSASALFVKDDGTWKRAQRFFVKDAGVWYQVLQAEIPREATSTSSVPAATSYFSDAELDNPLLVKRLTIPAAVSITAPAGSNYAMSIRHRGWKGDLIIDVFGTMSGRGGTVALGVGGDVIFANGVGDDGQKAIINNYGLMRSGGGPGGRGGQGGNGNYQSPYQYQEGPTWSNAYPGYFFIVPPSGSLGSQWAGVDLGPISSGAYVNGWYYYSGAWVSGISNQIYRVQTRYNTIATTGGAPGAGGRGQGSDGANTVGAAGLGPSGSGAGYGGTGGTGGGWGLPGNTGGTGGTGNVSGGAAGLVGGLAGFVIGTPANAIFNNYGTALGR